MKFAVVDMQGFVIDDKFFVKELSISNGKQVEHFLFKPTTNYSKLSRSDKRTVNYLEKKIHGIKYSSGCVEYADLGTILQNYLTDFEVVYVSGHQKRDILLNNYKGPIEVINLENYGWTLPPKLEKKRPLCLSHNGEAVMCSVTNCKDLYEWVISFIPR